MDYKKEIEQISRAAFRPVYFLDTEEAFFSTEFYHRLSETFFEAGQANAHTFRAREAESRGIIQEATATSLFSPRQIVRVVDALEFIKSNLAWFEDFLPQVADQTDPGTILFMEDNFKKYGRKKGYTAAKSVLKKLDKKHNFMLTIPPLKKFKVPPWLVSRAKTKYGIKLGTNEAKLIIENTGIDLMRIDVELDKMATFVLPRKVITAEDINELTLFDRENTIFEMLDALSARNPAMAVKHMKQLLTTGAAPIYMILMIFRHVKKLLRGKIWMEKGENRDYIGRELKVHHYFQDKFFRQVGNFTRGQLNVFMDAVQQSDRMAKSGADAEMALEKLMILMCTYENRFEPAGAR